MRIICILNEFMINGWEVLGIKEGGCEMSFGLGSFFS